MINQETSLQQLLADTAGRANRYLAEVAERHVAPLPADVARLEALGGPMPQSPSDPAEVLALLDEIGSPATVATTGRRYFGFVIGGTLPAALAANWLAGAWDQNAAMRVMSPVAAKLEEIVLAWMIDLMGPAGGFGRRVCNRHHDGKLYRAGGSAQLVAATCRLERGGGWAVWRSAHPRRGRG